MYLCSRILTNNNNLKFQYRFIHIHISMYKFKHIYTCMCISTIIVLFNKMLGINIYLFSITLSVLYYFLYVCSYIGFKFKILTYHFFKQLNVVTFPIYPVIMVSSSLGVDFSFFFLYFSNLFICHFYFKLQNFIFSLSTLIFVTFFL